MTSDPDLLTRHLSIAGRVQGVGFRNWTHWKARGLGLAGWVRNRRDGTVEAAFTGSAEAVAAMVEACRRGPPGAHVTGIVELPADEAAEGPFRVLPTL